MTDMNLYIPLAGTVESLKVSVAAAVILFQFIDRETGGEQAVCDTPHTFLSYGSL